MQLFFHPEISEDCQQVTFPRDESKHIVKVLRKIEGDILHLTNGKGFLFETEIISANHNNCSVKIRSAKKQKPAPYRLHLAVAPTKMNDRYEWFLEKATEIGVHEITPIICDHSERKVVKLNRYERVVQSAVKQSLNTYFPILNEAVTFSDFLQEQKLGQRFIAHCEDGEQKQSLKGSLQNNSEVIILIGPEGDFSSEEIRNALKHDWKSVSLGESRLRTETAAIVACHTVALAHEE
ncbi:ribosomal RNA small subunit methyltransferase E [Salinimicrobium marinum]|uniref:Ribosomal RNA small subunit methyltransferase E n=1 Tax=Salinimicrobium marinum TaxID=680283 RepID=A0A918S8V5_9FLAO|nr:16S rRNA (uracil(1498)-N(3))-methyltransferase [Salinimicrobium marinum]GHA30581.1 ribosomal RNA small subunit methyltransferase E [Salinimicrobium marinum]